MMTRNEWMNIEYEKKKKNVRGKIAYDYQARLMKRE